MEMKILLKRKETKEARNATGNVTDKAGAIHTNANGRSEQKQRKKKLLRDK
jgi:hypothetical protein